MSSVRESGQLLGRRQMLQGVQVMPKPPAKAKSKVNAAGNYTKPTMRKGLFESIKAGGKGGNPGQWSARKSQLLAKKYKGAGGGYRD
jgi:hypothetical protein